MRRTRLEAVAEPLAPALLGAFPVPASELSTAPEPAPPALVSTWLAPEAAASPPAMAESPALLAAPPAACEFERGLEHAATQAHAHAQTTANAPDEARLDRNISTPPLRPDPSSASPRGRPRLQTPPRKKSRARPECARYYCERGNESSASIARSATNPASSARPETPSFLNIEQIWLATVRTEVPRSAAISP